MSYNQEKFAEELAGIKAAADAGNSLAAVSMAATRGKQLLNAAGAVGNIVTGGNRAQLELQVQRCEHLVMGLTNHPAKG